jgi:hypothetical protein
MRSDELIDHTGGNRRRPTQMTKYTGSATIYRCAPWAKDPSVSGAGHDRAIQSPFPINETELTAWLTEHAPEVVGTEPVRYLDDDDPRNYYYLIGRDGRGYRTEVFVALKAA